jgi:YHS domain-containing protein
MKPKIKKIISVIISIELVAVLILLSGCKKSEPVTTESSTNTNQQIAQTEALNPPAETTTVEQTLCPIMGKPIDKDIYVEMFGKKVYFCCEECQDQFMEEPEKYLDKLPQFQK